MEETVAVKKEIVEEPDLADLVAKITLENKEWNEKNDSMNRNKSCVVPPAKLDPGDPLILDARSRQGCFGWTDGPITLPYIFRNDDKFCFVHFLQKRATEFFDKFLVPELIACFRMPSWRITSEESCLMNEINATHSSFKFGRYHFSSRELIVSLSDAVQMIEFLRIVKKKLQSNTWAEEDRCGFIKIGERWVVPYIIISGTKYFPLFYFEGEMEEMEKKAFRIQGWDLAYLKVCFDSNLLEIASLYTLNISLSNNSLSK